MTKILPIPAVEGARKQGEKLWFEYHCWESPRSADAELWYHSHQQVEILGLSPCDGHDIHSRNERYEAACLLAYRVRFEDGFEHDACEDELYEDPKEFCRPDPPDVLKKRKRNEKGDDHE